MSFIESTFAILLKQDLQQNYNNDRLWNEKNEKSKNEKVAEISKMKQNQKFENLSCMSFPSNKLWSMILSFRVP